jgi:phospholipase C
VPGPDASPTDAGEEPPVDVGNAQDATDASSCTPPPDAGALCAFKAGALVSETLGSCARTGARLPVDHIILLMQENRSFDHYLGHLKGNGQDDVDVAPDNAFNPSAGDGGAPVPWHHLDTLCNDDTNHEWDGSHIEWNGGKNDGFVVANVGPADSEGNDPTGSRAMGYYDQRDLPFYYQLASTFSISDRYFCDVLGPTFPNRFYYMAASSFGLIKNDFDQTNRRSIFTVLNEKKITWKVYASDVAVGFILHAFQNESSVPNEGLDGGADKVVSVSQFAIDAAANALPQVAWIDPLFLTGMATQTSEHPPADVQVGQKFVYDQVHALLSSPSWAKSVMFITYDENGGLYDHVAPPSACVPDDIAPLGGPMYGTFDHFGFRVPVYVVSPFAKSHFVSHEIHSHASILRFVEAKFNLPALSNRDANADAMLDMFDFDNPPFATPPSFAEPAVDMAGLEACKTKYGP